MSLDHEAVDEHATVPPGDNADTTPTAEVPLPLLAQEALDIVPVTQEKALDTHSDHPDGYFPAQPASSDLVKQTVTSSSDTTASAAPGLAALTLENIQASHAATLHPPRPIAHTANSSLSVQSSQSTATITAATADLGSSASPRPRPQFPNQAYSALQSQKYPSTRIPTLLRQRTAHPGQIYTFASAVASQQLARGSGSSAPATPGHGLFDLRTQLLSSDWETANAQGTYASPFLHFTQRVPPKETHVADVDVDPISGRKLINHYEIIDELGRGTHGKVKLGRDLSSENTYVAIKIVERFSKRRKLGRLGTTEDKVKKEVAILKQVRHPNVTALLEVIDDPSRKKVYIVLEWVERGQIHWRTQGPKEITTIEARRYEREKSGKTDARLEAEDLAIVNEVQRRLARQRRRQLRTFRRVRRDAPEAWSMELVGDDESEVSDDDMLSRVSSESFSSRLLQEGRRSSRTASPLPPISTEDVSRSEATDQYTSVVDDSQTQSPLALTNSITSLEGSMYGAYHASTAGIGNDPRVSSSQSLAARQRAQASSDSLAHMAAEVLDSDMDEELGYVPVMTAQQIRVAFRDTLLGLQYLHYQGIIHRDIKPPNLLCTREHRVKISDFGVSYLGRPMGEGEAGEGVSEHEAQDLDDGAKELAKTVGTPAFYAPELCITEVIDDAPPITKAIDVWALGVTLFCMLFARTPFVDNEFVVMRQIAEEEIYIPHQRLKPIETKSRSRPSSQGRAFPPVPSSRRHELELSYEEIGEELHDLLKRMLVKDPRKRITLEEVRHHAWVVADIQDKVAWLEETDPSRQSQGKKIEVSTEDVKTAVVPLHILDRVRYGIRKVGERLGLSSRPPTRDRGRSLVAGEQDASLSPSISHSPHVSQDDTRSITSDADLSTVSSREIEHPLSRSVNASPLQEKADHGHKRTLSRPMSTFGGERPSSMTMPLRLTEPASTSIQATGSIRTLKQADFPQARGTESPPRSPVAADTLMNVDPINGNTNGWAQRLFKSVRERSSVRSNGSRASSSERGSLPPLDVHAEPSLAVAQATAIGSLNSPVIQDDAASASSALHSPTISRPLSAVTSPSSDRLHPHASEGTLSRNSSTGSTSSLGRIAMMNMNLGRSPGGSHTKIATGSTAAEWQRAEDEHIRKLIREQGEEERDTSSSLHDRVTRDDCPPSPDDQRLREEQSRSRRISPLSIDDHNSSQETSPVGHDAPFPAAIASSTSDFGSAISMSTSDPSMPSAVSETSSLHSVDAVSPEAPKQKRDLMASDDTVSARSPRREEGFQEGQFYSHSEPIEDDNDDEDDYDDSSDSDGGLVMSRRRSATKPALGGSQMPSMTAGRKQSRSGSSNTMTKVDIHAGEGEHGAVTPGLDSS